MKYVKSFKIFEIFSKDNPPENDSEIEKNKTLIRKAVQKFDKIFGTNYYQKYGSDFRTVLGDTRYFLKEIIIYLRDETLKKGPDGFKHTKFIDNLTTTLYDNLIRDFLTNEKNTLKFIGDKIPNKINKTELFYKFFLNFGHNFNDELIKEVLEIKQKFENKREKDEMNKTIQRTFLKSMKEVMDMFSEKVKRNQTVFISSDTFFEKTLEKFKKSDLNKHIISDNYLKKRLNDWIKWVKDQTS